MDYVESLRGRLQRLQTRLGEIETALRQSGPAKIGALRTRDAAQVNAIVDLEQSLGANHGLLMRKIDRVLSELDKEWPGWDADDARN